MGASIFWYDFETTGTQPSRDRPLQVAGLRTDWELREIDQPINLYCRLSDDILPHPAACLVTGIGPAKLQSLGLTEVEFMTRLYGQLSAPQTCTAGYNNLRFDDEMTRYSLYRNFFDPYAREWQNGNSRWDLIDLVRGAYALRPEGIEWPRDAEGQVSLRLELLTQANGIAHGQAHDALADVRATIEMARLLRTCNRPLYDYYFSLRDKRTVLQRVRMLQPLVHVSGRYSARRHYLSVALPLAWHPANKNALVVCDLQGDIGAFLEESPEALRQRLYTKREDLPEGLAPLPLKLVYINRAPLLAPLGVLRKEDQERLGVDLPLCERQTQVLRQTQSLWQAKLPEIYRPGLVEPRDVEEQLYEGFLSERDRRLCEQVRQSPAESLGKDWPFTDARLPELLFRYRARNYSQSLTDAERRRWRDFCRRRLTDQECAAPQTLEHFFTELNKLRVPPPQVDLLQDWAKYAADLARQYDCE